MTSVYLSEHKFGLKDFFTTAVLHDFKFEAFESLLFTFDVKRTHNAQNSA